MRIAIFGATSQIAKDLIIMFSAKSNHDLVLFARRPNTVSNWLTSVGLDKQYPVYDFQYFFRDDCFDVLINFVGAGEPAKIANMGSSIFDVTSKYDQMACAYVRDHPDCRYIFSSSGAVYNSVFDNPVHEKSMARVEINNLNTWDWYAVAKLSAECRHRSYSDLPIVDFRIFNYFSHRQDISARFLITDMIRAVQTDQIFKTSNDNIVRDYIGPWEVYSLISLILEAPPINEVIDCYTTEPVDKSSLLSTMQKRFGLVYETSEVKEGINATGMKMNYYSMNKRAEMFGYYPSRKSIDVVVEEVSLLGL